MPTTWGSHALSPVSYSPNLVPPPLSPRAVGRPPDGRPDMPRVAPWYALLVSLTLGRIDRGAPSALAPSQVMSPELNPDSEVRKVNVSKSIKLGDFPAG